MLTQVKISESKHLTIRAVYRDEDTICLIFYGDKFALVQVCPYGSRELVDNMVSINPDDFYLWWPQKLIELGVLTKEEYESAQAAHEQRKAERQLALKRKQLEQLQKELGS